VSAVRIQKVKTKKDFRDFLRFPRQVYRDDPNWVPPLIVDVKDYRQSGVSYLLYSMLEENAVKKGYQWCEISWQLEDNEPINRFVASIGGNIHKKYRIYEKKI
jgi:hypothetical protein